MALRLFRPRPAKRIRSFALFILLPAFSFFFLNGCFNLQRPARFVEQYTLEYPSPEFPDLNFLETSLSLNRFQEFRAFNTAAMIYRPGPYQLESYQYHRWRVHPADLVGDHLLRDLRRSGLFRGVFSPLDAREGRFVLEGTVEEFLEIEEGGRREAVLALSVALIDSAPGSAERILFQKRYRFREGVEEKSPRGLAKGLSRAMEKISENVIRDVHRAVSGGLP